MLLKEKDYYFQSRQEVLVHVPSSVRTLLDIGCGGGVFSRELRKRQPVEVWGVEINQEIAKCAEVNVDHLLIGDIVRVLDELPNNYFDCIVCNDVLEHLYDPYELLSRLRNKLKPDGIVLCSLPNIRFMKVMKRLLFQKEWEYTTSGVLDFTHIRFFTKKSIVNMFDRLNYRIIDIKGLTAKKVGLDFWIFNAILGGLLEDMRFSQFLCKVASKG